VIATDPRYHKLYLIAQHEIDGRIRPSRYLTVYDLDDMGDPVGEPRSYEVGKVVNGIVNPSIAAIVQAMAFHPTLHRLYLVGHGWHGVRSYALSPEGEPEADTYTFHEIPTPQGTGKHAMAVSDDGKRLYLGAISTKPLDQLPANDLQVVTLDEQGMPQTGTVQTFSSNAFEPGKTTADYLRFVYTPRALYRIPRALPDGTPKTAWPLLVWPLDPATGLPVGNGFQAVDSLQHRALAVDPVRNLLWVANDGTVQDAFSGELRHDRTLPLPVPVDARGFPRLDQIPKVEPVLLQEGVLAGVAARTGIPVLFTQAIPQTINYVKDYHFRLTLLEAEAMTSPTPSAFTCNFTTYPTTGSTTIGSSALPLNQPSPWMNLDAVLRDRPDQVVLIINLLGKPLKHVKLQVEVALGNPNTSAPRQTLIETVVGNQALFLLPGYRFHPERDRKTAIERLSQHSQKYLQAAQAVALAPEERPRQFIVSCTQCIGGQGHLEQLQNQVGAIRSLGFNTAMVYYWGNLPPEVINGVLDADPNHPFHHALGVYNPLNNVPLFIKSGLTYFDFCVDGSLKYKDTVITAATFDVWAEALASNFQKQNIPLQSVVNMALSDEPGWVYPLMLRLLSDNPGSLEEFTDPNGPSFAWVDPGSHPNQGFLQQFRAYLAQQGLTPNDVGHADWSQVYAIGAHTATPTDADGLPTAAITLRRLFYWTMRFFAESASRGHAVAQAALHKAFGPQLQVFVNWNNWVNNWYLPAPGEKIFNYPNHGPDTAGAGFDWFTSGRLNAHTLWTEDEFPDWHAHIWSFYGDVLHAAARQGNRTFGGYVRAYGKRIGAHAAGASYKMLALIGHGAKTVNVYSYGTAFLFGNCWSEQFESYRPIAEALRLIGRGERVLFPGQPVPGHVALFLPNASRLWDEQMRGPYYLHEIQHVHTALVHAGYRVEFVDDRDIAQGALTDRAITTLYLTGPNVSAAAQEQVVAWVAAGGTLVVTPGAGVADEYNEPSTRLDTVLGLVPGSRKAVRAIADSSLYRPPSFKLHMTDERLLALLDSDTALDLPLRDLYQLQLQPDGALKTVAGPAFAPLQPQGAAVAAVLLPLDGSPATPQPALTLHQHGEGRAFAYSFFPGWQYWNTPRHAANPPAGPIFTDCLPRHWGRIERNLAVLPTRVAETPKAVVVSHEVVEVCRLQSDKGIALVILNWTDEPIQVLTLDVPDVRGLTHVTSLQGSTISSHVLDATTLRIQLSIAAVDVVLIE
jgi:hypothetical protein